MQEQSFEKQVRDQLEELSFVPSGSVWQQVEKNIHRKKERRRVALWVCSLLLLPAGFFLWKQTSPRSGAATETAAVAPAAPLTAGRGIAPVPASGPGTTASAGITTNGRVPAGTASGSDVPAGTVAAHPVAPVMGRASSSVTGRTASTNDVPSARLPGGRRSAAKGQKPETIIYGEKANANVPGGLGREAGAPLLAVRTLPEPQMRDSLSLTKRMRALKVPAVEAPPVQPKKWHWGVEGSAGLSGMALLKRSPEQAPGPDPLFAAMPSPDYSSAPGMKPGITVAAGLRVARSLTDRLSLTAGLRYQQFRTKMNMDQSALYNTLDGNSGGSSRVGSFGPGTIREDYTNKYHFVELPLGVEYRLSEHLPLTGHTGLSVGRLIRTNALNYQDATGLYSGDQSLLRKTQASLFAGLSYPVARLGKATLVAGPSAQVGLTNLINDKSSKRQHLYTAGLQARVAF
ncbi:outer membrane beta-barrel protein [Paraflavisolibacter sp. H34]|uniref:outer membrane beta-barrel protein n=1 Tax=Huijunlia imazamoxiresistens TaxID=3127457 RepID=UPI003017F193